jgi:hypothetical protein
MISRVTNRCAAWRRTEFPGPESRAFARSRFVLAVVAHRPDSIFIEDAFGYPSDTIERAHG